MFVKIIELVLYHRIIINTLSRTRAKTGRVGSSRPVLDHGGRVGRRAMSSGTATNHN